MTAPSEQKNNTEVAQEHREEGGRSRSSNDKVGETREQLGAIEMKHAPTTRRRTESTDK